MVAVNEPQIERREHFRINDVLPIKYQIIDAETADALGQQYLNNELGQDKQDQEQLRVLQTAFSHIHDQINHYDRDVARALRILNDKIEILGRSLDKKEHDLEDIIRQDVNLSGGGLSLITNEQLTTKTPVKIQLELRSSGVIIEAIARVIACNKDGADNTFVLRLAFTHMNEQDRDLLIKHILFRQAEHLRASNTKYDEL